MINNAWNDPSAISERDILCKIAYCMIAIQIGIEIIEGFSSKLNINIINFIMIKYN